MMFYKKFFVAGDSTCFSEWFSKWCRVNIHTDIENHTSTAQLLYLCQDLFAMRMRCVRTGTWTRDEPLWVERLRQFCTADNSWWTFDSCKIATDKSNNAWQQLFSSCLNNSPISGIHSTLSYCIFPCLAAFIVHYQLQTMLPNNRFTSCLFIV